MIPSIQDSPEIWQRVVRKRIQFSRENPQHALVWPFKTLYNITKCGVFFKGLPQEPLCQEYLYILCEFVEHSFETIGSKLCGLSNKMYKYSRYR